MCLPSALLAGVNVDRLDACFALDVTAPVELALAALLDRSLERVVASSATHQIAAVHAGRRPVARPAVSTCPNNPIYKIESLLFICNLYLTKDPMVLLRKQ